MADTPITGIIICDHGSKRTESNQMLETFTQLFIQRKDYAIVEAAHMELAEPSIETAVRNCAKRGATHIVLAPYFLAPGKHWHKDLPALTQSACEKINQETGTALSWLVAQPIGLHQAMTDIIDDRIQHCTAKANGQADACQACAGSDRCQFHCSK